MMARRRRDQGCLFYEFRLDDRIPANHLLPRINVFVTVAASPPCNPVSYGCAGSASSL